MINDNFLVELAKALAGESYVVPTYLAFGSSVLTESATSTSLSGEFGSRVAVTDSRALNVVTFNGLRSGASVSTSAGDTLNGMALFSSSSGGTILTNTALSSIIHSTAYDIEVDSVITISRP